MMVKRQKIPLKLERQERLYLGTKACIYLEIIEKSIAGLFSVI